MIYVISLFKPGIESADLSFLTMEVFYKISFPAAQVVSISKKKYNVFNFICIFLFIFA